MFLRSVLLSTLIGASLIAPALAGECPADKMKADAVKPVNYGPKDVTDKVLATIDLSKEKVAINGHLMRVRRLEIQPGGIVPWHSHAERPALIVRRVRRDRRARQQLRRADRAQGGRGRA